MAKPKIPNQRKANLAHKQRVEKYAQLIQQVYDNMAHEAARLAGLSDPDGAVPFRFSDYPLTKNAIVGLQTQLTSDVKAIIMAGTSDEWKESNLLQDLIAEKVITAYTGTRRNGDEYERYFQTNPEALKAFQERKDEGMNLSTRVWDLSEQYKTELEESITAAIAPGTSAMELAAEVKQYLKEPKKRFRRIKEKMEDGTIKWNLSRPAKAYHPGQGVYRSSARNAQRLARTEINMAYRTAEQKRWEQFDFVVGYEVKTTQNGKHVEDICDQLAGKYPKDFVFKGWHPQCMCYCIPILKTEDEFWAYDPENPQKSANEITELPPNFREWIDDNRERIEAAEKRGKLPYFISDNREDVEDILNPKPKKTPLEIAAERHAARTAKDAEKIREKWSYHKVNQFWDAINDGYLPKDCVSKIQELKDDIAFGDFDEFNRKAKVLDTSIKRHKNRNSSEAHDIQARWDAKRKQDEQTKMVASNVLKVAQQWSEVDYSALEQLISDNNLTAMRAEAKAVANAVKAMKAEENALSDIIPEVHKWHDTFSLSELKATKDAVLNTLSKLDQSDLSKYKSSLEYESDWVINKTSHKTKNIAYAAYQKQIKEVEEKIYWEDCTNKATKLITSISSQHPKITSSIKGKIDQAIKDKNTKSVESYIYNLSKWEKIIDLEKSLSGSGVDISDLKKHIKNGKLNKAWSEYQKLISTAVVENTSLQSGHYGSMGLSDALAKIQAETKCSLSKAQDYYDAVNGFSFQWDYEIRQVQCGNGASLVSRHGHTLEEIEKRARNLEEFIQNSPKWDGGKTFRGMSLSPLELDNLKDELNKGIFNNLGSASWSSTQSVSESFSRMHLYETSPKFGDEKSLKVVLILEKQKWATSIQHISEFPYEDEVLASMKCRYGFVKEEKIGDTLYITVKAM